MLDERNGRKQGFDSTSHEDVRQTMMKILNQEHDIQKSVFDNMHASGFYPTPAAEEKKVQEAKQKFSNSTKVC